MLKDRIAELKAVRDQARADAERAEEAIERPGPTIIPQTLKTFARQARKRMRTENGGYRRDYLRALAQRVEVDVRRKFVSWDPKANCCARSSPLQAQNGGFWRAQFCTEVARPRGFEPLTFAFGG